MAGSRGKASSAAWKRRPAGEEAAPAGAALTRVRAEAAKGGAAAERRAQALLELIARRKAQIAEDFYEIGEALRELQRKKLYLALGHASFGDMLKARDIMGLTQAKKLIGVVAALPRDKALALGPEKAYALTRYTAATPEVDTPAWLMDQGATVAGKSLEEISVRELTAEVGKVRTQTAAPKRRDPEEQRAKAAARATQAALRKRGAKGATVEARRAKGGFWLRVEVPVEAAAALLGE
ncbi:hypothetical protein WME75_13800 [Sorangium sp. So ce1014]|uniref:hypothetical protein n=1 Tax=Sorangium sp. So ce1014 TaxID=3133326 RepID=UPI003F5F8EE2